MPWQIDATVTPNPAITQNPDRPQFLIVSWTFLNTDTSVQVVYTEPNVPDVGVASKLAADWLRQFNKIGAQLQSLPTDAESAAAVQALLTPPAPSPPSADDLALHALQLATQAQTQIAQLVADGILASTDPLVAQGQAAKDAAVVVAGKVLTTQAATAVQAATDATTTATSASAAVGPLPPMLVQP